MPGGLDVNTQCPSVTLKSFSDICREGGVMQCTNRSLLGALVVLVYAVSVEAQSRQVSVIKDVWGTDPKVWMEASPSCYLRADLPPVLLIYTDGDEEWRRKQNDDMAAALRSAGHKASFCRWTFAKHP